MQPDDPSLPPAATPESPSRSGNTFPVDAVAPAGNPIWTESLAASFSRRLRRKVLILPEGERPVTNPVIDLLHLRGSAAFDDAFAGSRCHPLIDAVHLAFAQHRPLTISPDHIWLAIAQGFSHHVTANAEKLRHRLVRHEGSRELSTDIPDMNLASFEHAIADFSSQIRDATDPVLHETLVCDFSTTTQGARTASEVALMDSFSSYFTYSMGCICGIPKITIQGTLDDWQRIRERVEVIETYGQERWVSRLRPILDEFVLAADGRPTPEFWKAIYKPEHAYGGDVATGWIVDLFPYLGDDPPRRFNHVLA